MTEPMSPFASMLFETARSCQGRPAVILDRVLTAKVRAWADEQQAAELASLKYNHAPPLPFEAEVLGETLPQHHIQGA